LGIKTRLILLKTDQFFNLSRVWFIKHGTQPFIISKKKTRHSINRTQTASFQALGPRPLATETMGSQARDAPLPAEKKINVSFNTNVKKNTVPFNTNVPSQGSQTNVSLPPPSRQVKRNSQTKH
jgi:hypothetical protein